MLFFVFYVLTFLKMVKGLLVPHLQKNERRRVIIMAFLWYIIIGGILGWLAGLILGKDVPGGVIGNIIAGIIGAWIGGMLLGSWGPKISDFYILPTLLGTIILILVVSFIMKAMRKAS